MTESTDLHATDAQVLSTEADRLVNDEYRCNVVPSGGSDAPHRP
jgi:hypothetical protein